MLTGRILIVDDDAAQRQLLGEFLREQGAEVDEAADGEEALRRLPRSRPDVVVTDLRMPRLDGEALVREIRRRNPEIRTVVVTAYASVRGAVRCLQLGARDFLEKPLDLDRVEHVVGRALAERRLERENSELRRRLGHIESVPGIVTAGGPMAEVLATVERVSRSDVPVLVLGESGTGKELVARALHSASPRHRGPFVAVNGGALSPTLLESELFGHERGAFTGADRTRVGRFEAARGGTLFLDEVGDLPPETQVKLLRVLQEGTVERVGSNTPRAVDVRVVAATHRDLLADLESGRFREDLYYRLAVVVLEIPPLRRRRADIPLLVDHFLGKHRREGGGEARFTRDAMDRLLTYDYPGNVRELENAVRHALALARGGAMTTLDLPSGLRGSSTAPNGGRSAPTLPERLEAVERAAILEALEEERGHQTRAARRLGLSERTLRYRMARLRLDNPSRPISGPAGPREIGANPPRRQPQEAGS